MNTTSRVIFVALFVLALISLPLAAETVQWLPAAASNSGLHGTVWTTDLWVYNSVADQSITVYLAFLPEMDGVENPVEVSIEIPTLRQVYIQDVVGSLFGENRPGAIRFRSEHDFEVKSRTFNSGGDAGTFGQGIPAVASNATFPGIVLLGASNEPSAIGTRTNLGLLNPNAETIEFIVFGYGPTIADSIGIERIELGPLGWWQGNVFELLGDEFSAVETAWVLVGSFETGRPVIGYLSTVDNASGDGTYIAAVDGKAIFTVPLDWTIDFTVEGTNATVDQLTVIVDGGDPEVFADLSSGATVTVESQVGEFVLCYSVDAIAAAGQTGSVTIEQIITPSYGPEEFRSHSESGSSGEFTVDYCETIWPEVRLDP